MNKKISSKQIMILLIISASLVSIVIGVFYYLGRFEVITVKPVAMNVRSGAGISYDIVSQVKKGDKLEILEEKDKWYRIKTDDNKDGWVASWLIEDSNSSPQTNTPATTNKDKVELLNDNKADAEVLETLKKGTSVVVTFEQDGWSRVKVSSKVGWISSAYLTLSSSSDESTTDSSDAESNEKYVIATNDDTKIRKSPSTDSEEVTSVKSGTKLTYTSLENDWYKVTTSDNKTGYVASWVVSEGSVDEEGQDNVTSIAEATIVVDAGHGGEDPGSSSNDNKYLEKDITLKTAIDLQEALETMGANVVMIRSTDTFVSLDNIVKKSEAAKADAFVSIHFDSTETEDEASGTTTFYNTEKSKTLAETVNKQLKKSLALDNRGVEIGDYQVIRDTTRPSILVELGFINNDTDVKYVASSSYQEKAAAAIAEGLKEYFK